MPRENRSRKGYQRKEPAARKRKITQKKTTAYNATKMNDELGEQEKQVLQSCRKLSPPKRRRKKRETTPTFAARKNLATTMTDPTFFQLPYPSAEGHSPASKNRAIDSSQHGYGRLTLHSGHPTDSCGSQNEINAHETTNRTGKRRKSPPHPTIPHMEGKRQPMNANRNVQVAQNRTSASLCSNPFSTNSMCTS